jgi:hypothetical protein
MLRIAIGIIVLALSVLIPRSVALCQVVGQPYRVSDREVEQTLKRIEQGSDRFRSSLDSALDKSPLDGTSREDEINAYVKQFYEVTKILRDRFNDHKSTSQDVQIVLERADRIDGFLRREPLNSRAQEDWTAVRTNLDQLANIYDVHWGWNGPGSRPGVVDVPYRISDKDVEKVLKHIEEQSDRFRSSLDSGLDRSRLDGTREEDNINAFVKDYYQSTKNLREHFDDHKSTTGDVQSVLDRASRIDTFMRRIRTGGNAMSDWNKLKVNLDELARLYNVTWRWGY